MNINIYHFSDLSSAAFTLPMQTIDVWFFKTEDFPPDAQDTQILSTEERNRIAGYSQEKDLVFFIALKNWNIELITPQTVSQVLLEQLAE